MEIYIEIWNAFPCNEQMWMVPVAMMLCSWLEGEISCRCKDLFSHAFRQYLMMAKLRNVLSQVPCMVRWSLQSISYCRIEYEEIGAIGMVLLPMMSSGDWKLEWNGLLRRKKRYNVRIEICYGSLLECTLSNRSRNNVVKICFYLYLL